MSSRLLRIISFALLALAAGACSDAGSPDRAATGAPTEPAERPVPQRTAEAAGSAMAYKCSDGAAIRIGADGLTANVTLKDGRQVALPRAESASKGGGDVFVGEALSVLREGSTAQLHHGEAAAVVCSAP